MMCCLCRQQLLTVDNSLSNSSRLLKFYMNSRSSIKRTVCVSYYFFFHKVYIFEWKIDNFKLHCTLTGLFVIFCSLCLCCCCCKKPPPFAPNCSVNVV